LCADEEAATGIVSKRPRDISARQALGDKTVLGLVIDRKFLRHDKPAYSSLLRTGLIQTRTFAHIIFTAFTASTSKMPFGIRWIAREMYRALRATFRFESQEACIRAVAEFIQYRYINPVIV
jgi:Ras GTPase-activating-like protein IQGAP2/3